MEEGKGLNERKRFLLVMVTLIVVFSLVFSVALILLQGSVGIRIWKETGNWGSTEATFSPDGKRMILQTSREIRLYNVEEKSLVWTFEYKAQPYGVAYSRLEDYVVAVSSYELFLFKANNPTPLWIAEISESNMKRGKLLDLSDDASRIVVGRTGFTDYPPRLYIFSRNSRSPLVEFVAGGEVNSVSISPNGELVAMGSEDGNVYLFRNDSTTPVMNYSTESIVTAVELSSDGSILMAGTLHGNILFLDLSAPHPLSTYGYATVGGEVCDIRIARATSLVFVASADNSIYVFDLNSPNVSKPVEKISTMIANKLVKVTDNGKRFITTNLIGGGKAVQWDMGSNIAVDVISWGRIESIDITPDGRYYLLSEVDKFAVFRSF